MHLPDEILSQILSPALTVPDRKFTSTESLSPFATYSEPSSAYLLVCKAWLRVATPLLYHVVVIRSKAQAATLARTLLQKDLNLGRFVKKLRIEGAYDAPLLTVFKNTPNVTDLYISLASIYASDDIEGLCQGIALISPTRLILQSPGGRENKSKTALIKAIAMAIPLWTHLTAFDIASFSADSIDTITSILKAISSKQQLTSVTVSELDSVDSVYEYLQLCPLTMIRLQDYSPRMSDSIPALVENATARSLLVWGEDAPVALTDVPATRKSSTLSPNSKHARSVVLISANQTVPDEILRTIFQFSKRRDRLPFLLVSKRFLRIGIEHFYAKTVLKSTFDIEAFDRVLVKYPSLRAQIRSLVVQPTWPHVLRPSSRNYPQDLLRFHNALAAVLSKLQAITRFEANAGQILCSWARLVQVASVARGLRTVSVHIVKEENVRASDAFNKLSECRFLSWTSETVFRPAEHNDVDSLGKLNELHILNSHGSFADVMARARLNALRRVVVSDDLWNTTNFKYTRLLQVHGSKLRTLELPGLQLSGLPGCIFDTCPALTKLSIVWPRNPRQPPSLPSTFFSPSSPCAHLVKLRLEFKVKNKLVFFAFHVDSSAYPDPSSVKRTDAPAREWETHFANLSKSLFPNLREIQMVHCSWPKTERDIEKSPFVCWAEVLLKRDVRLVDANGQGWRPRLTL
ncbi:F-box domain-containing protein [Mycena chlorophos]|uniref:F-box domain-containing protein n=1 Tax=Mycena chlorophos TaxID=658473 RepID=A0A8H6SBV7_MYCCL|nr:F-box domain-containing protein [Mycena chlorophos]